MLETIRQYGAERLTDAGQVRALQRPAPRPLPGGGRTVRSREASDPTRPTGSCGCGASRGNIRAALEFCLGDPREASAAYDIAAQIWNFWFAGFLREGYRYLTRALDLATEQTAARAYGLWAASYLAMFATDFERNAEMLAECDEIAAGLDDPLLLARIKECRGQATLYQGDLPGAIDLLEQARREFQALGNALGEFDTLILLTACTFFLEDPRDDTFSRQALRAGGATRRPVVDGLCALGGRHRALASRRLRPGDASRCDGACGCSCRCTT